MSKLGAFVTKIPLRVMGTSATVGEGKGGRWISDRDRV